MIFLYVVCCFWLSMRLLSHLAQWCSSGVWGGCAQRWLSVEKYERNWRAQRVAHIHTHLYATANGALRAHTYEQLINLSKPTREQSEFELWTFAVRWRTAAKFHGFKTTSINARICRRIVGTPPYHLHAPTQAARLAASVLTRITVAVAQLKLSLIIVVKMPAASYYYYISPGRHSTANNASVGVGLGWRPSGRSVAGGIHCFSTIGCNTYRFFLCWLCCAPP